MFWSLSKIKTISCGASLINATNANLFVSSATASIHLLSIDPVGTLQFLLRWSQLFFQSWHRYFTLVVELHSSFRSAFRCWCHLCLFLGHSDDQNPHQFWSNKSNTPNIRRTVSSILTSVLFWILPAKAFFWDHWFIFQMRPTACLKKTDSFLIHRHFWLVSAAARATIIVPA